MSLTPFPPPLVLQHLGGACSFGLDEREGTGSGRMSIVGHPSNCVRTPLKVLRIASIWRDPVCRGLRSGGAARVASCQRRSPAPRLDDWQSPASSPAAAATAASAPRIEGGRLREQPSACLRGRRARTSRRVRERTRARVADGGPPRVACPRTARAARQAPDSPASRRCDVARPAPTEVAPARGAAALGGTAADGVRRGRRCAAAAALDAPRQDAALRALGRTGRLPAGHRERGDGA